MATKTLTQIFSEIADAIRAKAVSSETFTPEEMAAAIEAIQSGLYIESGSYYVPDDGTYSNLNEQRINETAIIKNGAPLQHSDGIAYYYDSTNVAAVSKAVLNVDVDYGMIEQLENAVVKDGEWIQENEGGVYIYGSAVGGLEQIKYPGAVVDTTGYQASGIYRWYSAVPGRAELERLQDEVYDIDDNGEIRGNQQLTPNNPYIFDPGFSTGSSFRPIDNIVMHNGEIADVGVYAWNSSTKECEQLQSKKAYMIGDAGGASLRLQDEVYDIDDNGEIRGNQQLTPNNPYIFDPGFSTGSSFRPIDNIVMHNGEIADVGVYAWNSSTKECEQLQSKKAYMIGDAGGASLIEKGYYDIGSGVATRLENEIISNGTKIWPGDANGAVYGFNADDQFTVFADEGYLQIQEGVAPHYVTPPTGGVDLVKGAYLISQAGTYTNANMPSPKTVEYNKYYYGNLTELPYNFVIAGGNKADAGTMYWNGSDFELTKFENPGYLYLDGTGKMPSYVTPKEGITLETGIYGVQQTGTFTDDNPPTKLDYLQDSYAYVYNQGAFGELHSCFIDSNGQPRESVQGPVALLITDSGDLEQELDKGIIYQGVPVQGLYWSYSGSFQEAHGPLIDWGDIGNAPQSINLSDLLTTPYDLYDTDHGLVYHLTATVESITD